MPDGRDREVCVSPIPRGHFVAGLRYGLIAAAGLSLFGKRAWRVREDGRAESLFEKS